MHGTASLSNYLNNVRAQESAAVICRAYDFDCEINYLKKQLFNAAHHQAFGSKVSPPLR